MIFAGLRRALRFRRTPSDRLIDRLAGPLDRLMDVLFQEASAGVLVVDRACRIVRANEALRRMLARRVDLSPGRPAVPIFHEAERAAIAEALHAALGGGRAADPLLARLETADADPDHMVSVSVSPLRESDLRISGLILRISDLTVQKRLEAQLAHSQKLQAVGQLAGGIAHDFNNLLTAILGAADLVLARPELDPANVEDVGQIRASAERGAALVRQLLAFGRQQTLQPRAIAINEAIEDLSSMLRRLLGGRIRLELELEQPGRMVRVDPTQLDQVLINLAVNARDAMPEGGQLTLRSGHITLYRPLTRGQETIPPGRYVMIEVEDTGTGIPRDVLPRIFEPFFTTKRGSGGTGLGLSTVHGIVRQSDGFLAVDTELGKGTRFRLYLPRHDADPTVSILEPESPARASVSAPATSARRTALLVDDEEPIRRFAERALCHRGWAVLSAESAESALELLDKRCAGRGGEMPSVLISDVVMPGMDGPALVAGVRARCPDIPVVLVSGYAEDMVRQKCAGPGIVFLSKPYTLKELVARIEEAVRMAEVESAASC